ncbi:hypothetical protein Lfu02_14190 [Longispora fulva]|uniref:Uncharacterized protein n=1 Tax=Longispora fulva TaxID=619741 RepID=A0A8J7KNS5_9ACTN|nr:hypothetical protein [Longispora fulva]MBG6140571.1 hypothetical protein [Longispora fulva]GIG57047.1 hypothetical protein Lfu02_14190 [Longispora fulva]
MGTYVEITGDPDEVRGRGLNMKAAGETFHATAQGLIGDIEAAEGSAPWGNDKFGQEFLKTYHKDYDGKTFNDIVKSTLTETGPKISSTGQAIATAMSDYQFTDALGQSDISKSVKE